ncbi:hypothetical protein BDV93DRAFT_512134 [Ceratobasidium sp. AG-I]|nr:hypothetical protein BDV93DRAFT_512134 [Ceratobasidium sp. AG-I]
MPSATYSFNELQFTDAAFYHPTATFNPLSHNYPANHQPCLPHRLQEHAARPPSYQPDADLTPLLQADQSQAFDEPFDLCGFDNLPEEPEAQSTQLSYAKARRRCNLCKKEFRRRGALDEHYNTHTGERPHICPYCPASFAAKSNLSRHKKRRHSDQHHKSNSASKPTRMAPELPLAHAGLEPCYVFNFSSSDRNLLDAHAEKMRLNE